LSDFQIRQISESQRPHLLSFLRQDPANNIFLIGNVAAFGVRGRNIAFWGAFRQASLAGVAMLHGENACFYSPERACLDHLLPKVSMALNLSGELGLMEDVVSRLPAARLVWSTNEFFCRLEAGSFRRYDTVRVRPAVAGDLSLLTDLYVQSDGFSQLSRGQVSVQVERQLASARYHVRVSDGEIVCAAAAVAETEDTAMIVSVLTAPAARSRGHASAVVSSLCADLLARGKTPHLFYREDNEPAGRVYRKLGFVTIGRWKLARLSPIAKSLGMMR
jgi:predicted GNAT family acetyltransferase